MDAATFQNILPLICCIFGPAFFGFVFGFTFRDRIITHGVLGALVPDFIRTILEHWDKR